VQEFENREKTFIFALSDERLENISRTLSDRSNFEGGGFLGSRDRNRSNRLKTDKKHGPEDRAEGRPLAGSAPHLFFRFGNYRSTY